jgi:hypothetical protein
MGKKSQPKPTQIIEKFLKEIHWARFSPRFQVIVTHGMLELLVNELVEHSCKHGKKISEDTRTYPHSVKLVLLHEKEVISDHEYDLLNAWRGVRNDAAHGAQFELTHEVLNTFKGFKSSDGMLDFGDPENFTQLCCHTFGELWNNHNVIFTPIFEPQTPPSHN